MENFTVMCDKECGKLPWKRKSNHVESKAPNCIRCKNPHPCESMGITGGKYCRHCYKELLTNYILGK